MRKQVWIAVILAGIIGSLTGSLVTMYGLRDTDREMLPSTPPRFVRPHIEAGYDVQTSDPVLKEEAEITIEKCLFLVSGALETEREPAISRQILRAAQAALEGAAKTAIEELEGGVGKSGKRLIKWCPFWQQHVRPDHADGRNTSQEDYTFCGSTWQEVDRKLSDHLKSCPFDSLSW